MKYFITLNLNVSNVSAKLTEYAWGMPSPVVYLSFLENILIKSEFIETKNRDNFKHNMVYGVKKYELLKNITNRSSQRFGLELNKNSIAKDQGVGIAIRDNPRAILETDIMFEIDSSFSISTIKKKIEYQLENLKFAGGFISKYKVFISENKVRSMYNMLPTMIVSLNSQEEIKDTTDLIKKTLLRTKKDFRDSKSKDLSLTVLGYQSLKESGFTDYKYKHSFAEVITGLIGMKALTGEIIKNNNFQTWNFVEKGPFILAYGE